MIMSTDQPPSWHEVWYMYGQNDVILCLWGERLETYSCLSVANLFITYVIRSATSVLFLIKLTKVTTNKLQYLLRYINYNNSV